MVSLAAADAFAGGAAGASPNAPISRNDVAADRGAGGMSTAVWPSRRSGMQLVSPGEHPGVTMCHDHAPSLEMRRTWASL